MGWNLKIQYYLMVVLSVIVIGLLVTVYKFWFIPSPFMCFIFGIVSLALYVVHVLQQQTSRKKEITLISLILIYINLLISVFIYQVWKWEAIFTRFQMTKMFMILFLFVSFYLVIAYFRAKVSYKKVKGNQKHNNKWSMSKKKKDQFDQTNEVYIKLGEIYENPDK